MEPSVLATRVEQPMRKRVQVSRNQCQVSPQRRVCRASRSLFQCEVESNQHVRRAFRDLEVGTLQVSVSTRAALRKE